MSFEQEERYIVVKLKRLGSEEEAALREFLQSYQIDTEQCVVVEHDWGPIYDETWDAVKRLAEGRQSIASERDEAFAEVKARWQAEALELLSLQRPPGSMQRAWLQEEAAEIRRQCEEN